MGDFLDWEEATVGSNSFDRGGVITGMSMLWRVEVE